MHSRMLSVWNPQKVDDKWGNNYEMGDESEGKNFDNFGNEDMGWQILEVETIGQKWGNGYKNGNKGENLVMRTENINIGWQKVNASTETVLSVHCKQMIQKWDRNFKRPLRAKEGR